MVRDELTQRLAAIGRRKRELAPSDFNLSESTGGERSRIARLQPETVLALQDGPSNPLKIAIPAPEFVGQSDGTPGNTETFNLSYSIVDTPDTQSVVAWEDGTRIPIDSVDYQNNTVDVSPTGTSTAIMMYYISDEPATIEIVKANTEGTASETLYTGSLGLVHATNQNEQPELLNVSQSALQRFVAADMTLDVYVDAPYDAGFINAANGNYEGTNGLLQIQALQGEDSVPGLLPAVKQDMSRR